MTPDAKLQAEARDQAQEFADAIQQIVIQLVAERGTSADKKLAYSFALAEECVMTGFATLYAASCNDPSSAHGRAEFGKRRARTLFGKEIGRIRKELED